MDTESKSAAIRVNVTPQLHAELERIAKLHDVPVAHVVRRAIRFYLTESQPSFLEGALTRKEKKRD